MELKIIHFYPDLMSLYGSYANVAVLKRQLEAMGNTVTVETVQPGGDCDISSADFLFMGAGTERSQKAALADFIRFGDAVKTAAEQGMPMLFCGTAMELLGKTITDDTGKEYAGIAVAEQSLPITVISDGKLFKNNLKHAGKDLVWLKKQLENQKATIPDTLLLTVNRSNRIVFRRKEG